MYEEKYHFCNQNKVEGIPINPTLPEMFYSMDHGYRSKEELDDWYGKPYITSRTIDAFFETWEDWVAEQKSLGIDYPYSKEHFDKESEEDINIFLEENPTGVAYIVQCLDGWAWDRPTERGYYDNLRAALDHALKLRKKISEMQILLNRGKINEN